MSSEYDLVEKSVDESALSNPHSWRQSIQYVCVSVCARMCVCTCMCMFSKEDH